MASTTISQNNRLSAEVLGIIFSYYGSDAKPGKLLLETLLLVCKSWHLAAVGHRALWSHLQLHVQHEDTIDVLYRHAERRLQRSGTAPIDIELLNLLAIDTSPVVFEAGYAEELLPVSGACTVEDEYSKDYTSCKENGYGMSCSCLTTAYRCACDLLVLLAGPDGDFCRKWRSLTFYPTNYIRYDFEERRIALALSHPTPNLVSLTLHRVHLNSQMIPFLPWTPLLLQLALDDCFIPSLPGTSNLRFAGISWEANRIRQPPQTPQDLHLATQRQTLKLGLPSGYDVALPDRLPNLQELQLSGNHIPYTMTTMTMGRLNCLNILVEGMDLLSQVTGCASHDFWRVTELELCYSPLEQSEHSEFKNLVDQLLRQCDSLTSLKGDRKMLSVVLKLLWEQSLAAVSNGNHGQLLSHIGSERIFGGREIDLQRLFDEKPLQRLGPAVSHQDLAIMAENLDAIDPEKDWDEIFELLDEMEDMYEY